MDVEMLLLSFMLLFSSPGASFADCPQSKYDGLTGTVLSHEGEFYQNNLNCSYDIRVPVGRRAILEFKKLKIAGMMPECEQDSLEIIVGCNDNSIHLGKFCSCSELVMPEKIYSLDHCITLIFKTDGSGQNTGFEANYTSMDNNTKLDPTSNCSQKFFNQASGTFFTPNWPLTYHQNAGCTWNFSIPSGREVRLFYTSFKLGGSPFCNKNRENEEDELRITGTNTTGQEIFIEKRICSHSSPSFKSYFTLKQMKNVQVKFASEGTTQTKSDESGVVVNYASYRTASSLSGCQSHPTVKPSTVKSSTVHESTVRANNSSGWSSQKNKTL
ncbi:exoskeleton protein RP43-like [Stylophora pistillata]|uniref:exoskeleton protein RP43-like n=1 Tax=Stylophora pistillata TaxID=50429 RepID=UPI000C0541A4|nr:exoskeleton protein RP43-like [Stylophora pistillata]